MINVAQVNSRKSLKAFIDFPHTLYADDVNYVPELFVAQRDLLSPDKHPFHHHATVQLFLAYEKDKIVGRIAAILNKKHNEFNHTRDGFFGFFDCINDQNVAKSLMDAVYSWLQAFDVQTIIGPVNFSTNETCGLLIEGFDQPPSFMMPYNKPYYALLLEKLGFQKEVDLLAYQLRWEGLDERPLRLVDKMKQKLEQKGITIRKLDLKNFKTEVKNVCDVYNEAWDKNFGFVPMTKEEFEYAAKDLKLIYDPDLCLVAEHQGKIIGFSLSIPDINQILIKIKRGRLLPTGIMKLIFGRKNIKTIRIMALGVVAHYRKMGIETVFYGDLVKKCRQKNIIKAEASWVLETNTIMNSALLHFNAKICKKYRIYYNKNYNFIYNNNGG